MYILNKIAPQTPYTADAEPSSAQYSTAEQSTAELVQYRIAGRR